MVPGPEGAGAAAAEAALGMVGVGQDADACPGRLFAFFVHGQKAAAGALAAW